MAADKQALTSKEQVEWGPCTYQCYDAMQLVRQAARGLAKPGQRVIYRDAFRWKDDADDSVIPNHYECQGLAYLAEEWGYEILHDFHHVAVIRRKVR